MQKLQTLAAFSLVVGLGLPPLSAADTAGTHPSEGQEPHLVADATAPPQKPFDGFFGGVGLGSQNVIAGSAIAGRDVLARDDLAVLDLFGGWRKQLGYGLVLGVELQVGRFDAILTQTDEITGAKIRYEGDTQLAYGVTLGYAPGRRQQTLLYAYAYETERVFDVTIGSRGEIFTQTDQQGILRYGLGAELRWDRSWHLRGAVGTTRADFGDVPTNIDADGEVELTFGVLYSF